MRTQELKKQKKKYTFSYKPLAMAGRVSFSVRPQALPTYPNTRIYLYEQQRNKSTKFIREKIFEVPFLSLQTISNGQSR